MEKKWIYLISGILGAIVIISIFTSLTLYFLVKDQMKYHEPITIMKDEDFKYYNFPGEGSVSKPYIIENYNITTTDDYAIYMKSTTKHVIIRNCFLKANLTGIRIENVNSGSINITENICKNNKYYGINLVFSSNVSVSSNYCNDNGLLGIQLLDCSDLNLINNTCNDSSYGIYLFNSDNITLTNNTLSNNFYASVKVECSSNINLINNTCTDNFYEGIRLDQSSNIVLMKNTCNNNHHGIYLLNSNNLIIYNNTFSKSLLFGITLKSVTNTCLKNNTFYECGLSISQNTIDDYFSLTVENNWINGKLLGYFINSSGAIISSPIYNQLFLINCSDMIVSNQDIVNASDGLTLTYCENTTITNNHIKNSHSGIQLSSSFNVTLTKNTCEYNWYGISVHDSNICSLTNNTCNYNEHEGISLEDSSHITLTNNTCNYNDVDGIDISHSTNVIGIENICYYNDWAGISLSSSEAFLTNNEINYNDHGLILGHSDNCLITYNVFKENTDYAISLLYESDYNKIHHNNFIDNKSGATSQAEDEWENNKWYDSSTHKGNYWSDWSGSGDYEIDGNANAVDLYPLSNPC